MRFFQRMICAISKLIFHPSLPLLSALLILFIICGIFPTLSFVSIFRERQDCFGIRKSVGISKLQHDDISSTVRSSPVRYLWCVNHYGPNNQLKDFIKCAVLAIMKNFTLIIPPLYTHYLDQIQGIQQFEQFYDLERLAFALKFIKMKTFLQANKNYQNQTIMDCYLQEERLDEHMMYFANEAFKTVQKHQRVSVNFYRHVNLTSNPSAEEIDKRSENCSSTFLNIHYWALNNLTSAFNAHVQTIFSHMHRTALVQRLASQLKMTLPELLVGNYSRSNLTTLAVVHMRLGDRVVMSVQMYLDQIMELAHSGIQFTHLHIMSPYLKTIDIYQLATRLSFGFTTSQTLFDHARFLIDDYLFDIVEQELALQAPIFFASPWSTYSATVLLQKLHQHRGSVYIFRSGKEHRTFVVTKDNAIYYN